MKIPSRCLTGLLLFSASVFAASVPGISNFDKVDDHVYRGAQPTNEGIRYLAQIGVKTVIDLRETGSRSKAEEQAVANAGMKYVSVPMSGLTPPTEAQIGSVLSLLENTTAGAVFVHCKRGADRTGTVVAAYHIEHDQWDSARALTDAKAHRMSPLQIPRQNYIRNFASRQVAEAPAQQTVAAAEQTTDTSAERSTSSAGVALAQ